MAEGVRGSLTVAFDQPRKEGKPHSWQAKEVTFHECVDGVTPKSTSPTDQKYECMKMFGGDYVVCSEGDGLGPLPIERCLQSVGDVGLAIRLRLVGGRCAPVEVSL